MERSRTNRLREEIEEKSRHTLSPEQLVAKLRELAVLAIQEENFHEAYLAFRELDDKDSLRQLSRTCLRKKSFWDASLIYKFLDDRAGFLEIIQMADEKEDPVLVEEAAFNYFGQQRVLAIQETFQQWIISKGFSEAPIFSSIKSIKMAYHLAPQYDIGVGIAQAGLYFTYMCTLFGLDTRIVECHRIEKGGIFRWCEEVSPDKLEGKKVVVLENDVRSGRTVQRVLSELQKYNPSCIDLALIHDSVPPPQIFGIIQENIPSGYGRIHFPRDFSYSGFDKMVERLDEKIKDFE